MDKPPKTSAQESPMDDETPKPKLELVPPTEEELDEEEKEFRALRRDLPGVKGASAAGIVAISVGKAPPKNEFFRCHPEFRPIIPMVNCEMGMERHYFAVTPDMVEPLAGIGISVTDHALYLTVPRAVRCGSFQCGKPTATASRMSTTAPRKSPCCRRASSGCACTPIWKTVATGFFLHQPIGSATRNGQC